MWLGHRALCGSMQSRRRANQGVLALSRYRFEAFLNFQTVACAQPVMQPIILTVHYNDAEP